MCERCYKIYADDSYNEIYYDGIDDCDCSCPENEMVDGRCELCGHLVRKKE